MSDEQPIIFEKLPIPASSMIMGKQGFECVIKGFRIGRQARRPSWPEDRIILWDKKIQCILVSDPQAALGFKMWLGSGSTAPSDADLMAEDWEVWG